MSKPVSGEILTSAEVAEIKARATAVGVGGSICMCALPGCKPCKAASKFEQHSHRDVLALCDSHAEMERERDETRKAKREVERDADARHDDVERLESQNAAMREALARLDDVEWRRSMYRTGVVYDGPFADLGVFSPMKFFDDFAAEFRSILAALQSAPQSAPAANTEDKCAGNLRAENKIGQ